MRTYSTHTARAEGSRPARLQAARRADFASTVVPLQPRGRARRTLATAAASGGAPSPRSVAIAALQVQQQQQVRRQQQQWWRRLIPGGGPAEQEDAFHGIRQVSEAELEDLLLGADATGRPLVVVFSAHWCGPCQLLAKQITATAAAMRAAGGAGCDAEWVKVEAPDEDALASRLRVHQLPCTFFVGGRGRGAPALRMEGLLAGQVIEDAVRVKSAVLGSDLRRAILL